MGRTRHARRGGLAPLAGAVLLMLLLAAGLARLSGASPSGEPGWTLVSDQGRPVSDRSFRGRFLLVYFGYTVCADECPLTLAAVSEAVRRLGPGSAGLQPVFVTVDPARDTPAVLHRYVAAFGDGLVGLTGTPDQLASLRRRFGIASELEPAARPGAGERVAHSSVLLLFGPDGRFLRPIPAESSPERIAGVLAPYLARPPVAG